MKKGWRVVTLDVNGAESGELGRARTLWGARRIEKRHRDAGRRIHGAAAPTGILEPIPGKPLYSIYIEQAQ